MLSNPVADRGGGGVTAPPPNLSHPENLCRVCVTGADRGRSLPPPRNVEDVTRAMSKGGGGACECLLHPPLGNPVSAPVTLMRQLLSAQTFITSLLTLTIHQLLEVHSLSTRPTGPWGPDATRIRPKPAASIEFALLSPNSLSTLDVAKLPPMLAHLVVKPNRFPSDMVRPCGYCY